MDRTIQVERERMKWGTYPEPTKEQFNSYQELYDYLNDALFENHLPDCLLNFSRLSNDTIAFFAPKTWKKEGEEHSIHEISLNPTFLWSGKNIETVSSLCHEMVHLWQHEFGKPGRRGYHNKQWANKMERIGLIPSDTGRKGGKKTGEHMGDYVEKGGVFERVFNKIPEKCFLPWKYSSSTFWIEGTDEKPKVEIQRKKDKIKYSCPICKNINVWGKPFLKIICGQCYDKNSKPVYLKIAN